MILDVMRRRQEYCWCRSAALSASCKPEVESLMVDEIWYGWIDGDQTLAVEVLWKGLDEDQEVWIGVKGVD